MANRNNTFLLKRSSVAGKIPTAGSLLLGEIALNTADAILYTSGTTANTILPIGWDRIARTGDTMTGSFYAPTISASTISATTYLNLPSMSGSFLPLSGGTVTGATIFTNGLIANTISATTYYNLPLDVFTTGVTVSNGSVTFNRNDSMSAYTFGFSGVNISVISDDVNKRITFSASTGGGSSLPTLNNSQIFIGDTSNVAQARNVSGDIGLDYSGLTTIQPNVVTYDKMQVVSQHAVLGSPNLTGGTVEEIPIIDGYVFSGDTVANLLDNVSNWDINGVYTGTPITGTYQGQSHYNSSYWFTAVNDNVWIRLIRG